MAKYEAHFTGDIQSFLTYIDDEIRSKSISASYEDGTDNIVGDVRVVVRIYERYSYIGGNRVSLNVTVVSSDKNIYITAITSGGSQAVMFKFNTFGESAFLDTFIKSVESYISNHK